VRLTNETTVRYALMIEEGRRQERGYFYYTLHTRSERERMAISRSLAPLLKRALTRRLQGGNGAAWR